MNEKLTAEKILHFLEGQCNTSKTGISFDKIPPCDGEQGGFRFMRKHHICQPGRTLEESIKIAMKELRP